MVQLLDSGNCICKITLYMLKSNDAFDLALSKSWKQEGEIECSGARAIELQGCTAEEPKLGGWVAAALILGIELCERLSTMGIAVNLVTYLSGTMHLSSAASANIVTNFLGTSFLLCLLGGFLADSFLGRYRTVAIFAPIQAFGTAMLAIATRIPHLHPPPCDAHSNSTCQQASNMQIAALCGSLYLIALGTGGIKSSVSGFGSDQFDENNEKEKAQMTLFFSRFFFLISLGTLMAVTILVYIQDRVGRSWGYGICSVSMFIAILCFLFGTKSYRYKDCCRSPIVHIFQVIVAATKKRKLQLPANSEELYEDTPDISRIPHTDQFRFLDKAAVISKENETCKSFASNPWNLSSITKVEEVKMMISLLPVWGTTIMFWTTYAQMITFSVEQASTMERKIGNFEIPPASLTVFFVAAILITLAAYDRLIIPLWKKWQGKPGWTNLQRIGLGLFLASLGNAAAAIAEVKRLSVARAAAPNTPTLPLSVHILIPQFFLIGSGEAFIYSGQLDFFITQSPKGMKTMSTGLFLTTLSLGFFFSSLLVSIVQKVTTSPQGGKGWVAERINEGRLDCFYALLASLTFIDFLMYLVCATWYKPQTTEKNQEMSKFVAVSTMEEVVV